MYEKCSVSQRLGLVYGFKLRVIGAIEGNLNQTRAQWQDFNVFTEEEMLQIEYITQTAKDRAKKEYYDAKAKLPPKGLGK